MYVVGVDVGGTKCAVSLGEVLEDSVNLVHKCIIKSTKEYTPSKMLEVLASDILECKGILKNGEEIKGIGISCGSPLNSKKGVILSPPNLIGWDNVHIVEYFEEKTGIKAWLCNDANACALAEWRLGAGRGSSNMIFLTFGTGFGAGIILDNRLYSGTNDMAGEIGHIRVSEYGPSGFGKMGSFEGFCSGGGIAQLAKTMIREKLQLGEKPAMCLTMEELESITAADIGAAAKNGDLLAREILKKVGEQLGKGLSILIDLLNPEKIVIGSIFARCYDEIYPYAKEVIDKETLSIPRKACEILPSGLSESVGDIAGIIVADYNIRLNG